MDSDNMVWTSFPVSSFRGQVQAPGDKSCSHRSLLMAGLADGVTDITGLLEGADVMATAGMVEACGACVDQTGPGLWRIVGRQGYRTPDRELDFGNSGTGVRLGMGALAGYDIRASLTGDASLSARPMTRILDPLSLMGARVIGDTEGRLPLTLIGSRSLQAIDYTPPHASAQIKSAILLAGLNADGTTVLRETCATRDHTERMLRGFGVEVSSVPGPGDGRVISLQGRQTLQGARADIPGDPSSAAFLTAAALISSQGEILIEGLMSNETRDGFFMQAQAMGARIGAELQGEACGERLVDMSVTSASRLKGVEVPERYVPSMIDEFPILAVVAAFAKGETRVTGAYELRVKETDRIRAIVDMLRVNGVNIEKREDGFVIEGCDGPPPGGGVVETRGDHRIAMSALVLGTAAQNPVSVDDVSMIATSYPDFMAHMLACGARLEEAGS